MTLREMARIAFTEPFRPFRIQIDDGMAFHVHHPDMIALGVTKLRISAWMSEFDDEAKTQEVTLLMNHIDSIQ